MFCPIHSFLEQVCAVSGCNNPSDVAQGFRTCALPAHRDPELDSKVQSKANFQLRSTLQSSTPSNAAPTDDNDSPELLDVPLVPDFDKGSQAYQPLTSNTRSHPPGKSERVKFNALVRQRTHNEQLLVRPCGVILSRATFGGSEGVMSVKVSNISTRVSLKS